MRDLFDNLFHLNRIDSEIARLRGEQQSAACRIDSLSRERQAYESAAWDIYQAAGFPEGVVNFGGERAYEFSDDGTLSPGLLVTSRRLMSPLDAAFTPQPDGSADRDDILPIPAEAVTDYLPKEWPAVEPGAVVDADDLLASMAADLQVRRCGWPEPDLVAEPFAPHPIDCATSYRVPRGG